MSSHFLQQGGVVKPQGGTRYVHIWGGKSDIFGLEYYKKW